MIWTRRHDWQATLGWMAVLLCPGRLLQGSPERSEGEHLVGAAIGLVAEVNRGVTDLVSEIQRLASETDSPEARWQRLRTRSRGFQATLPALRSHLDASLRTVREALSSRREIWSFQRQRAAVLRQRLRASFRRLSVEARAFEGIAAECRVAARRRYQKSLELTGGGMTARLNALLRRAARREEARTRQLNKLDALSHELDRVAMKIEVYLGVLESELPVVDGGIAAGADVFRWDVFDKLKILGMTPRELAGSLESLQRQIMLLLRL